MAATVTRSSLNQYSSSVTSGTTPSALWKPYDVPDWTKMQKRVDTPLLQAISRKPAQDNTNIYRYWGWGSPDPITDTLGGNQSSTSSTTWTVSNSAYFAVGMYFKVDSEIGRVTSITDSTHIEASRAQLGTSGATHTSGATVVLLGPIIAENADDPATPITQGETDYNVHNILSFTWTLSQRAKVTRTFESQKFPGTRDQQELRKKMDYTAPLALELIAMLGVRTLGDGTGAPSVMGGLTQSSYITTSVSLSSAALTEYDLNQNLQTVHNLVGPSLCGDTIMCSPFFARVISSWYSDYRTMDMGSTKVNLKVTEIDTWFGTLKIIPNYLWQTVPDYQNRIIVANWDDFAIAPYHSTTGWQTGMLATQGWYSRGYLRGDFTMIALNPDSRLMLTSLSTTAGDYAGLA